MAQLIERVTARNYGIIRSCAKLIHDERSGMFNFLGQLVAFISVVLIICLVVKKSRESSTSETRPQIDPAQTHIIYGASLINDGYEYFPDWGALMIREFDDRINPDLQRYFDAAKSIAEQPRDKWAYLISQSSKQD